MGFLDDVGKGIGDAGNFALGHADDILLGAATGGLYNVGKFAVGGYGTGPGTLHGDIFGDGQDPGALGFGVRGVNGAGLNPNASSMDAGPQNQFRDDQRTLATLLAQQANGLGPSLAQNQLQSAGDQNMRQAMALQASQRGPQSAGSFLNIANRQSQIGSQLGQDSANLRLQEQMAARNQLASLLGGARGQDIGFAGQQQQGNLTFQQILSQNQLGNEAIKQHAFDTAGANRAGVVNALGNFAMKGAMG